MKEFKKPDLTAPRYRPQVNSIMNKEFFDDTPSPTPIPATATPEPTLTSTPTPLPATNVPTADMAIVSSEATRIFDKNIELKFGDKSSLKNLAIN